MSTPLARSPRAAIGTSAPTRQQLDELDALLQRMLDLPVNHAEEEAEQEEPAEPPRQRQAEPPRREPRLPEAAPPVIGSIQPTPAVVPLRVVPRREEPDAEPQAKPPAEAPRPRAYPASYMVVETNNPFFTQPESPPREVSQRAADNGLEPRMLEEEPEPPEQDQPQEEPVSEVEQDSSAGEPWMVRSVLDDTPAEWVPFQSSWQPSEQTWKPLAESWEQARTIPLPTPEPPPVAAPPRKKPEELPTPRPTRQVMHNPPPVSPPAGPVVTTQTAEVPEVPQAPEAFVRPKSPALPEEFLAPVKPPAPKEPPVREVPAVAQATGPARSVVLLPLVWFNVVFDVGLTLGGPLGTWLKGKNGRGFLGTIGLLCLLAAIALAVADGIGWTW